VAVGLIFVLLLTVVAIVSLAASVVDTVRLRRRAAGVRQRAVQRTAHYPAWAYAYSYPPRHRFTWPTRRSVRLTAPQRLPGAVTACERDASASARAATCVDRETQPRPLLLAQANGQPDGETLPAVSGQTRRRFSRSAPKLA
jgi:hypothetical protein